MDLRIVRLWERGSAGGGMMRFSGASTIVGSLRGRCPRYLGRTLFSVCPLFEYLPRRRVT